MHANTRTAALTLAACCLLALSCTGHALADEPTSAAELAAFGPPQQRQAAIKELRQQGPAGLDALLALREQATPNLSDPQRDGQHWRAWQQAVDQVAQQKDAWASGLYWYTDLEKAKAVAQQQGKPILSLRMLGHLDSDLSCANSRFFRTVLYANKTVADHLRENYVLHWTSVREVPVVTIDFGDGRVVTQTITGNSIHYILDGRGRVMDALPGLLRPAHFLDQLKQHPPARAKVLTDADDAMFARAIQQDLAQELERLQTFLRRDLEMAKLSAKQLAQQQDLGLNPLAAQLITTGKARRQIPTVRAIYPQLAKLIDTTDQATWRKLATLPQHRTRFDDNSIMLMLTKLTPEQSSTQTRYTQDELAAICFASPLEPLPDVLHEFGESVSMDTVLNSYKLRPLILKHIAETYEPLVRPIDIGTSTPATVTTLPTVAQINAWVYEQVFIMPTDDPFLGLDDPRAFDALTPRVNTPAPAVQAATR